MRQALLRSADARRRLRVVGARPVSWLVPFQPAGSSMLTSQIREESGPQLLNGAHNSAAMFAMYLQVDQYVLPRVTARVLQVATCFVHMRSAQLLCIVVEQRTVLQAWSISLVNKQFHDTHLTTHARSKPFSCHFCVRTVLACTIINVKLTFTCRNS